MIIDAKTTLFGNFSDLKNEQAVTIGTKLLKVTTKIMIRANSSLIAKFLSVSV